MTKEQRYEAVRKALETGNWLLRFDYDGAAHGGFRWQPVGQWTEAPDWAPAPVCGGGLHGQGPEGYGYCKEARRLVFCDTGPERVVVDGNKTKVRRARVLLVDAEVFEVLAGTGWLERVAWSDGGTPLHWAARYGRAAVAALLLDRGADVDAKDGDGCNPLHVAAWKGHGAVAALLLDRGAGVDAKGIGGRTPLHLAALDGHAAVAALLLDRGADLAEKDADGQTPLHLAAWCGYAAVVTLLLERGADLAAKGADGWTPLDRAAECGHAAVAALLRQHGATE